MIKIGSVMVILIMLLLSLLLYTKQNSTCFAITEPINAIEVNKITLDNGNTLNITTNIKVDGSITYYPCDNTIISVFVQ